MVFKKKLHLLNPDALCFSVNTQYTKRKKRIIKVSVQSNERCWREALANKLSGAHLGLWLLVPEYLRLGAWDLLSGLFKDTQRLSAQTAMQLVNEAALCVTRIRQRNSLCNQGFSLLNGLSFLATDESVHELLNQHSIAEYEQLQITLMQLRYVQGHYSEQNILALDPHRICSATQRIMPMKKKRPQEPAHKMLQTFFCVDALTGQPQGFTIGAGGTTCSKATLQLLELIQHPARNILLLADKEHFTIEIFNYIQKHSHLNILMPAPNTKKINKIFPGLNYQRKWAGYAIAETTFQFDRQSNVYPLFVQRTGERPQDYEYKAFLSTTRQAPVELLSQSFPRRWSIEEFFNFEADMGWNRASTFNLNIRYGKQTLALIAQAAEFQFRNKLPKPYTQWTAKHTAQELFTNMEGDIRIADDTIIVTYYKSHHNLELQHHYQNLPAILQREGINPKIPWLFNYKLDFRFK
jgi:hypothetical protein